jgi:tRNA threonylcarbamoyladenosine modification (KEOPS) complex Cgi121 subunit
MILEKIGSYFLLIQGVRGARITASDEILNELRRKFEGVDLQLFRADRLAGKEHIIFAARNAVDSFAGEGRRTKHLAVELLLFASGEHQIVEAIKLLGVSSSGSKIVVVGLSREKSSSTDFSTRVLKVTKGEPDDAVIDLDSQSKLIDLKKAYNFSDKQLGSARMPGESEASVLKRLIIERSALLALHN